MNWRNGLTALVLLILTGNKCFSQDNISTGSRLLSNINYSVHDMIGDTFLGSMNNSTISIEHSILSRQPNSILSIDDLNNIEMSIYPSPFSSKINVDFQNDSDYIIRITSSTGKEIKSVMTIGSTTINTNSFPKGIYIITVLDRKQGGFKTLELVKL